MQRTALREARELKGWTLEEAAEYIGVDKNTVWRWEQGISPPYTSHNVETPLAGVLPRAPVPYGAHLSGLWPDSGPTGPAAAQSPQGTAGTGETAAQAGGRRTAGARGGAQATRRHDRRRPAPAALVSDG